MMLGPPLSPSVDWFGNTCEPWLQMQVVCHPKVDAAKDMEIPFSDGATPNAASQALTKA